MISPMPRTLALLVHAPVACAHAFSYRQLFKHVNRWQNCGRQPGIGSEATYLLAQHTEPSIQLRGASKLTLLSQGVPVQLAQ